MDLSVSVTFSSNVIIVRHCLLHAIVYCVAESVHLRKSGPTIMLHGAARDFRFQTYVVTEVWCLWHPHWSLHLATKDTDMSKKTYWFSCGTLIELPVLSSDVTMDIYLTRTDQGRRYAHIACLCSGIACPLPTPSTRHLCTKLPPPPTPHHNILDLCLCKCIICPSLPDN